MSETMIERVGKAIAAVRIFSRFNDWTSDKVEGLPIEICRHGEDNGDEVIIKRFPASKGEDAALREVVSEMRARAAIEAMREPTTGMLRGLLIHRGYDPDAKEETLDALGNLDIATMGALVSNYKVMIDAALSPPSNGDK